MTTSCFHDRIREFKFSDGEVIKMCPDCTTFDSKRRTLLFDNGKPLFPTHTQVHHWETTLADFDGLNPKSGSSQDWLEYHGCSHDLLMFEKVSGYAPNDLLHDYEWEQRQTPFPHSHSMPRKLNHYCPHCTEIVLSNQRPWVTRITKGVYLPVDHECDAVRVYDLKGNLLEVKAQ